MRKGRRFRVFNGCQVRLGAENFNGEQYAVYDVKLTGAKEINKNSEYGQLTYFIEFLGGPQVVVNFVFVNIAFQLGFYLLLTMDGSPLKSF